MTYGRKILFYYIFSNQSYHKYRHIRIPNLPSLSTFLWLTKFGMLSLRYTVYLDDSISYTLFDRVKFFHSRSWMLEYGLHFPLNNSQKIWFGYFFIVLCNKIGTVGYKNKKKTENYLCALFNARFNRFRMEDLVRSLEDFFGLIMGADVVLRASLGSLLEFSPVEPQARLVWQKF